MDTIKKKLNSSNFKEFIRLSDLVPDQKHTIENFCINSSQYGPQLRVVVDKRYYLNLPNRFLKDFSEQDCKKINEQQDKITMIYKGSKSLLNGKITHLIEFE